MVRGLTVGLGAAALVADLKMRSSSGLSSLLPSRYHAPYLFLRNQQLVANTFGPCFFCSSPSFSLPFPSNFRPSQGKEVGGVEGGGGWKDEWAMRNTGRGLIVCAMMGKAR